MTQTNDNSSFAQLSIFTYSECEREWYANLIGKPLRKIVNFCVGMICPTKDCDGEVICSPKVFKGFYE